MRIPHRAELIIDMVDDAITAYESDNLTLIEGFSARDDTVDALRHSIFREGISFMMEDPKNIRAARTTLWSPVALNAVLTMPANLPRTSITWRPGKE